MKSASTPGVPNPRSKQARDLAGPPPQRVSGGWADQSFICPSPSLPVPGITTRTTLVPCPAPNPTARPWRKIGNHETCPWCPKAGRCSAPPSRLRTHRGGWSCVETCVPLTWMARCFRETAGAVEAGDAALSWALAACNSHQLGNT